MTIITRRAILHASSLIMKRLFPRDTPRFSREATVMATHNGFGQKARPAWSGRILHEQGHLLGTRQLARDAGQALFRGPYHTCRG